MVVVGEAKADEGAQLAQESLGDVHSVVLFRLLLLMNGVLCRNASSKQ